VSNWFQSDTDSQKRRLFGVSGPAFVHADEKGSADYQPWAYRLCSVRDGVDHAVDGTWSIPAFQRNFSWNPLGVRDLADSLLRDYPIGPLLIWERKGDTDAMQLPSLIIDGQHRLTSLCILFGRRPRWWSDEKRERWSEIASSYEVWFDVGAESEHFFWTATESKFDRENPRFVGLSKLLTLDLLKQSDRQELRRVAAQIEIRGAPGKLHTEQSYGRLMRVCAMKTKPLMATILHHPHLDDVLEIFARLNGQGIRFRQLLLSTAIHATSRLWNR
jgi:uncharacterized protein DUF262